MPESGFQVEFPSHKIASEMLVGKTVSADITVKNISPVAWPSKPDHKDRYAVNLSYHWLDRSGETVVFDGLRTPLPRDLGPGESVDLKAAIQPPEKPGRYVLEITLVQERAAWFPEKKGAKLVLPVRVTEAGEASATAAADDQTAGRSVKPQRRSGASKRAVESAAATQTTAKTGKPDSGSGAPWSVQLGSYAEKKVAAKLAEKLKAKGYDAYVTAVNVKGKELHRVRVGRFASKAEAEKLRDTLKSAEKLDRGIVTSR
jgi:cell division septation protein DedD